MHPDDNSTALALLDQALAQDPNFANALANAAWCYEQLSPSDPAAFMFITGLAWVHYLSGRCGQALALATESAAIYPGWEFTWMVLATAAAALGQYERARAAIENVLRLLPFIKMSHPIFLVFTDPKRRAMVQDRLRKARLPE